MWNKVRQETDQDTIILQIPNSQGEFYEDEQTTIISFDLSKSYIGFVKGIYHLATSKVVFVDNYVGLLAGTPFHSNVECVQLWHANGAIKQFGMRDPSISHRSNRANERFQTVYNRFTHITVGSNEMADIFKEAFNTNNEVVLKTGVPRTDLFFDEANVESIKAKLEDLYPQINDKQVIMYAPTYREQELNDPDIHLDLDHLYQTLSDNYILLLRLHPAVKHQYDGKYSGFVIDVSDYSDLNHLLLVTDILISDYSSIPFEFSLLEKPMIFYPYDLESYRQERGFWEAYEKLVPGPIAIDTQDIAQLIKDNQFNLSQVREFSQIWNKYNDGFATQKLVNSIYEIDSLIPSGEQEDPSYQPVSNDS
ncbi:CDP-glycerol glycerophosphotransferase family protein [Alkalibacillus salilacus]|uniref:CDP-glycerol glycerophosphotransferase (TagB/SpsB family) n=1 Tax=Alkalibacillus salilacus TaxID=284582 RepID=A0ABT9VHU5_9BACI|nr:CDP-glycerol glycerophosphotransferase family protein [Alkalibacillus salilacus]MDQ0160526.1 CDP-glycerol glycerophosphotransferase (TagB/SpsB family) [Alkalibacillus salilacus]